MINIMIKVPKNMKEMQKDEMIEKKNKAKDEWPEKESKQGDETEELRLENSFNTSLISYWAETNSKLHV